MHITFSRTYVCFFYFPAVIYKDDGCICFYSLFFDNFITNIYQQYFTVFDGKIFLEVIKINAKELAELYDEYGKLIYRTALKLTRNIDMSEDITQEVFLKLLANKRASSEITNIRAWVFIITKNTAKDYFKKNSKYSAAPLPEIFQNDFSDTSNDRMMIQHMFDILGNKNEKWLDAVTAYYILGMSVPEISKALGCSNSSVRNNIYKAKKFLREYNSLKDYTTIIIVLSLILRMTDSILAS